MTSTVNHMGNIINEFSIYTSFRHKSLNYYVFANKALERFSTCDL